MQGAQNKAVFVFSNFQKAWTYQNAQLEEFKKQYPGTTVRMGIMGRDKYTVNFTLR